MQERAITQKFFVLSRTRCGTTGCPEELVETDGFDWEHLQCCYRAPASVRLPARTSGKPVQAYPVRHDACAPRECQYVYQLALLSSELREIFAKAPSILNPGDEPTDDHTRKAVEGDCPICFDELAAAQPDGIVWCQAACGQKHPQAMLRNLGCY